MKVKMNIQYVGFDGKFHELSDNVILTFPDGFGVFPLPKRDRVWNALREQRPDLVAKLPRQNHLIAGIAPLSAEEIQ